MSHPLLEQNFGSSSCLAAGYNRDGVVKLVGGTLQAVAVFKSDCEVLGL